MSKEFKYITLVFLVSGFVILGLGIVFRVLNMDFATGFCLGLSFVLIAAGLVFLFLNFLRKRKTFNRA